MLLIEFLISQCEIDKRSRTSEQGFTGSLLQPTDGEQGTNPLVCLLTPSLSRGEWVLIWGEGRGVSGCLQGIAWVVCLPFGGVECRRQAQYPALLLVLQK